MIILFILLGILFILLLIKQKRLHMGSFVLVTGGVKCGKSTFAIWYARKRYRQALIKYRFQKLFNKTVEKPLLYSNIPLSCEYVPLTSALLSRKERFSYGSVIYCGEVSLVADSMMFKDAELNERLLMFNKLIGHELHGGCIVYDTQSIQDCHYSIKRCTSSYIYINKLIKFIPFVLIAHVREDRYSEDGSVITANDEDVEKQLGWVIIPKRIWKLFDCYCYSSFTDDLPCSDTSIKLPKGASLKASNITSFKNFMTIKNRSKYNEH